MLKKALPLSISLAGARALPDKRQGYPNNRSLAGFAEDLELALMLLDDSSADPQTQAIAYFFARIDSRKLRLSAAAELQEAGHEPGHPVELLIDYAERAVARIVSRDLLQE